MAAIGHCWQNTMVHYFACYWHVKQPKSMNNKSNHKHCFLNAHPVVRGPREQQTCLRFTLSPWIFFKVDCLLVGCLTSQQQASVSRGRICSQNFTCCHTDIEVADPTFYLTHSQYTDTRPTSPSADPITPGAWQGSHWSANF